MKQRVVKKIPEKVIQNARGLAIFTTMRTGLWVSGAGGSGVLIARQTDGTWSPPSGILLHTAGLGFLVGVDIYDCVLVLNTDAAVEAFTKIRCTLGGEVSVVAGPVGAGGMLETELHKRQAPIFTYIKSRGFYAGVQIDGTVIIERNDENERFYGEIMPVKDILSGKVRHPPYELKMLTETLKAAQGDTQFDASALPLEPPPGDYLLEDGRPFGVPDKEDPDPYGVLALEKEGLSLKEAGTQKRASWEEFGFHPSPTSPIHSIYSRQGHDERTRASISTRSSWRVSAFASHEPKSPSSLRNSIDTTSSSQIKLVEMSTQTDDTLPQNPVHVSRSSSQMESLNNVNPPHKQEPLKDPVPTTHFPTNISEENGITTPPHTPLMEQIKEDHRGDDDDDDDLDDSLGDDLDAHIEEPVVHAIQKTPAAQTVINKARLVSVPKRGPPPVLPPRNPGRRGPIVIDASPRPGSAQGSEDGIPASPTVTDASALPQVDATQGTQSTSTAMTERPDSREDERLIDDVKPIALVDQETDNTRREEWRANDEKVQTQESSPPKMPGGFD
nr:sh3 domain-containing ysc84-like protein 1 [Quercus suber]